MSTCKMKSKRSLNGRVKVSSKGKVTYRSSGKRHLLTKKSGKRKRSLESIKEIKDKTIQKTIKKLLCVYKVKKGK